MIRASVAPQIEHFSSSQPSFSRDRSISAHGRSTVAAAQIRLFELYYSVHLLYISAFVSQYLVLSPQ